jgi:hypothetical protein
MRIISIDGGGYLGLATASFLQAIEQRFDAAAADRFDLFCGTSTGAIIALALASGKSARDVVMLYEQLGVRVFKRPPLYQRAIPMARTARQFVRCLHDNGPLREALADTFGDLTLGDLRARGKLVLITAFNVTTGTPTVFKTDHSANLKLHDMYLVRDVALASSAAPTYLPLVDLKDPISGVTERFCDGGVVANSPALLGYAEAVYDLRCHPADVAVLSLGTPRADLAERPSALSLFQRPLRRGLAGWHYGERIIAVTMDGSAKVSHYGLQRIAHATNTFYERVDMQAPPGVGLDIATPAATATLRQVGAALGRDVKTCARVAPFFTQTEIS